MWKLTTLVNATLSSLTHLHHHYGNSSAIPIRAHISKLNISLQTPLLHHYHPSVSLHARQLLSSQPLTASADLSQNTLSHFLDRFVYKNPKKLKATENAMGTGKSKGASAMQPAASGLDGVGVKLMKGEVDDEGLMNEDGFLKKRAEDVPVDQVSTLIAPV